MTTSATLPAQETPLFSAWWWINAFFAAETLFFLVILAHAWLHQDDYWLAKRQEDAHLRHFRDKVAGSWIFYDGRGF